MMNVDLKQENIKKLQKVISLLDEVKNDDWLIGLVDENDDLEKIKIEVIKVKNLIEQ
jgi:hypothetical protein